MKISYPYPSGDGKVKWVSTEWLEKNLKEKTMMILDTQPNIHDYIQEHIPGATYMNEGLLRVPLKGRPGTYVPPDVIQGIFKRLGLHPKIPVVIYTGLGPFKGWGDGLEQTMVAYSLARFGHDKIYLLDGGIDKWKQENKPLTKEFPSIQESKFPLTIRQEYFINYDEFKEMKDDDQVILLDARPPNVYEGQGPWMKPGHIPGAINLPWASLMDDVNKRLLKPLTEIQDILHHHGISSEKIIICSCGTGREATNEFLLFKWLLKYPKVKIYEGSFTEWSSYPNNSTVTGPHPR